MSSVVVVTGSRTLTADPQRLQIKAHLLQAIHDLHPTAVFHGGAAGPDAWAAAEFHDIQRCVRPDYDELGQSPSEALFTRNITMVKEACHLAGLRHQPLLLVSCWDGKSNGTWHCTNYARSQAIPTIKVPVELLRKAAPPQTGATAPEAQATHDSRS